MLPSTLTDGMTTRARFFFILFLCMFFFFLVLLFSFCPFANVLQGLYCVKYGGLILFVANIIQLQLCCADIWKRCEASKNNKHKTLLSQSNEYSRCHFVSLLVFVLLCRSFNWVYDMIIFVLLYILFLFCSSYVWTMNMQMHFVAECGGPNDFCCLSMTIYIFTFSLLFVALFHGTVPKIRWTLTLSMVMLVGRESNIEVSEFSSTTKAHQTERIKKWDNAIFSRLVVVVVVDFIVSQNDSAFPHNTQFLLCSGDQTRNSDVCCVCTITNR